jgi:hypothetical protein
VVVNKKKTEITELAFLYQCPRVGMENNTTGVESA